MNSLNYTGSSWVNGLVAMTYVVGIRGGIGSGKTAVSDLFAQLQVTVADADVAARVVVEPGQPLLNKIKNHFGDKVIQADGCLNRGVLRNIIFQNAVERKWLESLTHPAIMDHCLRTLSSAKSEYSILVLSTGAGRSSLMNRLLVVDAPREVQIARVMARDKNTTEQVEAIINNQESRQERLACADDIILNDGDTQTLKLKVNQLHHQYLELALQQNQQHESVNE